MALTIISYGTDIDEELLNVALAERVMGWAVGPDRYSIGDKRWLSRWRFQPAKRLEDAFRALEQAAPEQFVIVGDERGIFATVRLREVTGVARGSSKAFVLSCALARALKLFLPE